jgi:outer membrane protein assembly factor BamB
MKPLAILSVSLFSLVCVPTARAAVPGSADAAAVAKVNAALPTLGYSAGATVRSATIDNGALHIEFSPDVAAGIDEARMMDVADAVRDAYMDVDGIREFVLTANGRSLASYIPDGPLVTPEPNIGGGQAITAGPLAGKTIAISPGHGWYWYNEGSPTGWRLQRSYYFGIVEDFMNHEMMQYVYNLLVNAGATVYSTREMDKTAGVADQPINFAGLSRPAPNKPWWQMAAVYNVRRLGAPSSVWDNASTTDYNRDITSRPLYANWRNADIMVSLHNNAFNGTGTGTETLYDTNNGYGTQSLSLASKIQSAVVNQIRANYISNWPNRGAKGFNGSYGENRRATRPAALIEVAFFDTEDPDSLALRDENFRLLVAKGIYEGICSYFGVTPVYQTNIFGSTGKSTAQPLTKLWELNTNDAITSPITTSDGVAWAGSRSGVLYSVAATTASGRTPGTLIRRYPASGNLGAPILARPTLYIDTIYLAAANGRLTALDASTGALRWSATVPNSGNLTSSPSVTSDGKVYIGSDNGKVYAYSAVSGQLVYTSANTFGAITGTVAIPDDARVWVTSEDGSVRRLSNDLQTILWSANVGSPIFSSPYVETSGNAVYFTTQKGAYALNAGTGSPADGWPTSGAALFTWPVSVSPWVDVAADRLVFATENETILSIAASTGRNVTNVVLRPDGVKEFTGTPVVRNGVIYIGGTDGKFYALDQAAPSANPGASWRVFDSSAERLPGQFLAAPAITGSGPNDVVVAGNTNGRIYAFTP